MRMHNYYTSIPLLLLFCLITTNAYIVRPPVTLPAATPSSYTLPPTHAYKRIPKISSAYLFMAPQNAARAELGLRPLTWDRKLASYAKWWASQRKQDCALQHSSGPYGENIFWGSSTDFTPDQAAQDWVSEKKYYNYGDNSCAEGQDCGHYTQIVWKNSKRIGCAKAECYNGGVFMICNYDPPGNYIGEKPY
ncbi:defense/immunity protein [Lithospermum erythrorhizon]|uniref:Defense/immunity protein n=1 Tax=Lithospermum erythrorhizon TaxID=34254 RepID=A0AAV3RD51_LITER